MAEIALHGLTKVFANGTRAVHDVSLRVADGEILVLVGPSGSGKTTLLRLIAGLETLTSGTIRIQGAVVNDLPPARRRVGMVFQRPALYPHLNVRANLEFGLRLSGTASRTEIDQRVAETAQLLGLQHVLERRPGTLSGGQQQRVALGRALIRRPPVILLDEPFSSLDGPLRSELRRELHLLQRRLGTTMIYVTHDQLEGLALADRLAVLEGGRLQQLDSPKRVFDFPNHRMVAAFLGWPPMNLVDGRLTQVEGQVSFEVDGRALPLPPGVATTLLERIGRPICLGIRPQDVALSGLQGAAESHAITLRLLVTLTESVGTGVLVSGRWGDQHLSALCVSSGTLPGVGEEAEFIIALRRAHWFDGTDGRALAMGETSQELSDETC